MIKLKEIMVQETKQEEEFAETRMAGAEKIVDNAKEKGGLAMLTWHHFKVKLPYYKLKGISASHLARSSLSTVLQHTANKSTKIYFRTRSTKYRG